MKHLLLLFTLSAFTLAAQAQVLSPSVLATSGSYTTAGSYTFSTTVGEMAAIQTVTGGGITLTQGFQQPQDELIGILEAENDGSGSFGIYPVPATDHLWFGYEFTDRGSVEVSMHDVTGRDIGYTFSEAYSSGKSVHSLDCSAYASGQYMLTARFTTASGQVKVFTKKFQVIN